MTTNIIVLAQARTGSCLLCNVFSMLNPCRNLNELFLSHKFAENPDNLSVVPHQHFFSAYEKALLFNYFKIKNNDYPALIKCLSENPQGAIDFLDKIIPVTKIIKILDHQMITSNLNFLFQKDNIKFVLLERSNKLEQFVSYETAKKSSHWVNTDTSNFKLHVDKTKFVNFVNESTSWYSQIRQQLSNNGHNFLEVNYETDLNVDSLDPLMFKIKDWLSTQGVETTIGSTEIFFKKQNSLPMPEKVLNFNDLRETFECGKKAT